jgi:hypothetical protein
VREAESGQPGCELGQTGPADKPDGAQNMTLLQRWKNTSLPNKLLIETGALVAFGTLFYAGAAVVQVSLMKQNAKDSAAQVERLVGTTNTAIDKAVQASSATLIEALRQNKEALNTAISQSKSSLDASTKQAKAALDASIEQNRLDQRAWLGFLESTNISFKVNEKPTITHWFINTGKTPATGIHGRVTSLVIPRGQPFRPDYINYKSTTEPSSSILMPNQRVFFAAEADRANNQAGLDQLVDKTVTMYFFGEVCYTDVFKKPHHVTFCNLLNTNLTTVGNCGTYNDTDDQPHDCK